ncbi:MAG: EAL domain-containing protein [Acidimicrobiales bacterium]
MSDEVQSAPLVLGASLANSVFPKTRSWFALGAPVELLRPLSVLRSDLVEWVLGELDRRALPPGCLTLEVTETMAADMVHPAELLEPLRRRGVRVSVDDFGTGHTSLGALPKLTLDELRIDRRFVQAAQGSPADDAIVATVSGLAHRLGLATVAEGVEDEATRERMIQAGYDLLLCFGPLCPWPASST